MFARTLKLLAAALAVNVAICWAVAVWGGPALVAPVRTLAAAEIERQLDRSFGARAWEPGSAAGQSVHGWMVRCSTLSASAAGEGPGLYYERVLKVGWPFTTARGFVRRAGADPVYDGAVPLAGGEGGCLGTILPVQLVWPGVVINTLLLAMLFGAAWVLFRRKTRPGS